MNSNNNKFLLPTSQSFEQPVDDKPFEILDTTSKSTASSPLHIGFETTRMDENIKDYAGTNFDGQELGFDSKNQKPSQFSNVYINNSIALNFTSNNIMSRHDAPNMAKKIKVTSSYTGTQKPQTEQYETRICLNCGEKNSMLQDSCCPACHSSVTAPSKGFNGDKSVQHDQHMRKEPWSNYVNLAGSQKNENLRINQPKFNPSAPAPNYDPNSYHFLPQNSQALIHPQVQANRNLLQGPPNNFSPFTEKDSGEYLRRNGPQGEDFYNAKQNNFDQGKKFEPIINNRIPPPPPPKNSPTKVYEGPNYCDQEASLSFKDELFTAANKDAGDQKKGVNKEMLDKLDEMSFEGGDAFSFQNAEQNDDDLDDMDGWQEMDFAGPEESSQEKPAIIPTVEEKRGVSLAKKKVEVIELSEHDSDKFSAESPKSSGLRRLLSKEDQKLFAPEQKQDEQPVDDLISFFIENSSKKTMLFQKEPLANAQLFSAPGEDLSKIAIEESGDSKGKDINYLGLIRSKSETQSIPKGVRIDNKKAQNVQKAEKAGEKEHKEEGQKGSKLDVGTLQKGVNESLITSILDQIEGNSNSSLISAEKTDQIVQSLPNNQTKAAANNGEKKPFVIHSKPRDKSVAAIKLGINLQKTSGSFKKKRQEKEKEKDLEREKERELNWEREHEKEREKLKELERQREQKEKEKEEKHKHRKEHHKENNKEKEHHKENHREKDKEVHKEKEHKENHKEKELHKEKEKEKEKDKEPLKEKVKEKEPLKEKEKVKEKPREKENKKVEAKMVEETPSEADSEESEYFMFGDEYDMILECYSQESQFVDVHEVKRRMDDFDFHMKDKEEIENIDEVLYPKKTIICIGGEFQTRIPTILEKNPFGKRAVCKIWDADRIQRQNYEHFMENLSNITKLPPANIQEEKAVEILTDNNYSVDQALRFVNQYLDYVKALIVYPQPPKKQEKEK